MWRSASQRTLQERQQVRMRVGLAVNSNKIPICAVGSSRTIQPTTCIRKTRAYALLRPLSRPRFAHLEVGCSCRAISALLQAACRYGPAWQPHRWKKLIFFCPDPVFFERIAEYYKQRAFSSFSSPMASCGQVLWEITGIRGLQGRVRMSRRGTSLCRSSISETDAIHENCDSYTGSRLRVAVHSQPHPHSQMAAWHFRQNRPPCVTLLWSF